MKELQAVSHVPQPLSLLFLREFISALGLSLRAS